MAKLSEYGKQVIQPWEKMQAEDLAKGNRPIEGTYVYEDCICSVRDAAGWCLLTYDDPLAIVDEWIEDGAVEAWGFTVTAIRAELVKCLETPATA